jgi:hypothetical protein
MMRDFYVDVRSAVRAWRGRRGLMLAILLTLIAGLGGAVGVFSVTYAVLWRPIDVPHPDKLVVVRTIDAGVTGLSSPGAALTWQARSRAFREMALVWRRSATVLFESRADRLDGAFASPELLSMLGATASQGRVFTDADAASPVVMISERYLRSRFGDHHPVVGSTWAVDGHPRVVVGVMTSNVAVLLGGLDWLAPLNLAPEQAANFGPRYLDVLGRVAPEMNQTVARAELESLVPGAVVSVTRLSDELVAAHRDLVLLLLAGGAVLLCIACANVAGLLLTQALDRHREFALRGCIGADRWRLTRQLLAEAVLVSSVAAAVGLIAGQWTVDALR